MPLKLLANSKIVLVIIKYSKEKVRGWSINGVYYKKHYLNKFHIASHFKTNMRCFLESEAFYAWLFGSPKAYCCNSSLIMFYN